MINLKTKHFSKMTMPPEADWEGNVLAVRCPLCDKVYVISGLFHEGGRWCPGCRKSQGFIDQKGTEARLEWDEPLDAPEE